MKFDNSDYPKNSEFFFDKNKKKIGKMKDDAAGMPVKEFIGYRSKMYSYSTDQTIVSDDVLKLMDIILENNTFPFDF